MKNSSFIPHHFLHKNLLSDAQTQILSPLRYPGGKGGLSKFLATVLRINNCVGSCYYEPFAGGAGAAFRLLSNRMVGDLFLNDADPCIYAFWKSALWETERFVDRTLSIPLTIKEWQRQKDVCFNPSGQSIFDLGFATFYLNRCNRSGIIVGAGPIGGYAQNGAWRLDARFNRESLASRILHLGEYRNSINIYNLDAITFLKAHLPKGKKRKDTFVYLDPPYYKAGRRLYLNFYKEEEHRALAKYILKQRALNWVMSYDKSDFISKLYRTCNEYLFLWRYSLQKKQKAEELLIVPHHLILPKHKELNKINMNLQSIKGVYSN